MSSSGEQASGPDQVRKLRIRAICRAKPARLPGTVYCLRHEPGECQYVRYFNEVAYCTHPKRESIIANTKRQ